MKTIGIDWGQFDTEKAVEELNEQEKAERLGQIVIIMEIQKKLNKSKNMLEILKRQKEEEKRKAERQRDRDDDDDRLCRESYQRNEREREEKEERRRVDDEWRNIKKMRYREERKAEKEWRCQEIKEKRRKERR